MSALAAWALIMPVQLAAAQEATIERLASAGVVVDERAQLQAAGKRALLKLAATLPAELQVTLALCVNPEGKFIPIELLDKVGAALVADWRAVQPLHAVHWVFRNINQIDCPAGLVLETRAPRPASPTAGLVYQRGDVRASLAGAPLDLDASSGVPLGALLETGPGSYARLLLPDGGLIALRPNSRLRLIAPGDKGERLGTAVRLLAGRLWVALQRAAGAPQGELLLAGPTAVAGVRGTELRLQALGEGASGTQLETLQGEVSLTPSSGASDTKAAGESSTPSGHLVATNLGARIDGAGQVIGPQQLPPAPLGLRPSAGSFAGQIPLSWQAVPGARAYLVEVAADVQFDQLVRELLVEQPGALLGDLPAGDWFWRVATVDSDGFTGRPSALYRVTIR